MNLMDRLRDPGGLYQAFLHVCEKARKDTPGLDGISLANFGRNAGRSITSIAIDLATGAYKPSPYRAVEIPKMSGGWRTICVPTVRDRVVMARMNAILAPILDPFISPRIFGYRPGRGMKAAIEYAQDLIARQGPYVLTPDIQNCYDSTDTTRPFMRLINLIPDEDFLSFMWKFQSTPILKDGQLLNAKGFRKGLAISPVLMDFTLGPVDREQETGDDEQARYADNFMLPRRSREECERSYDRLVQSLYTHCGLRLKPGSVIVDVREQPAVFLGIELGYQPARLAAGTVDRIRQTADQHHQREGRKRAIRYLKNVRNTFRSMVDISPISLMLNRFRTPKAPTGTSVATVQAVPPGTPPGTPAGTGLLCAAASGPSANGGGGKSPPPPAAQKAHFMAKQKRRPRFPDGDPMYWLSAPYSPDQLDNVTTALNTASHLSGSHKQGNLFDIICLEFNATYARERDDRDVLLNRLCARIEDNFGVRLIVIDKKKLEVLFGKEEVPD